VAVWRTDLVRALALLEATIDFVDEDVPVDVAPDVLACLTRVSADLRSEVATARGAERVRDGFEVAILGEPNAGKSTLLNALAGREAALTSAVAGTTRDVIEVRMDIRGLPVTLLDTAGLRDTTDEVEAMGIARALSRAADADLRIVLVSDGRLPEGLQPRDDDIVVGAKADVTGHGVSGLTGHGLDDLIDRVGAALADRVSGTGVLIRARHRIAADRALGALEDARIKLSGAATQTELAAEDVRAALRALESLIGRVDVEAVLGEIFASFCIGK
jgi:tRNA modification GTPase